MPTIPSLALDAQVRKAAPYLNPATANVPRATRPSTALGAKYNEGSKDIYQAISRILNGAYGAERPAGPPVPAPATPPLVRSTLNRNEGGWHLSSSLPRSHGIRSHSSPHTSSPPRGGTKLQRRQTRLAWLLLLPSLAVVALVAMYPLAQDGLPELHRPGVPRAPADAVGRPPELQGPLARHDVPPLDLGDDQVHADHGHVRVRARAVIALVVNSKFKGRGLMRAVMLVPWAIPTVVAAQMWKWMLDDTFGVINDAGRPASHPLALARLDLRAEHGARPRSARSTSGRRRRSSRCCCWPACR